MLLRANTVTRRCNQCGSLFQRVARCQWRDPDSFGVSCATQAAVGSCGLAVVAVAPPAAEPKSPEPSTSSWRGYALAGDNPHA